MDDAEPILVKEGPLTPVSAKNVESLKARVRDVYERNSKIESLIDLIDEDFIYGAREEKKRREWGPRRGKESGIG